MSTGFIEPTSGGLGVRFVPELCAPQAKSFFLWGNARVTDAHGADGRTSPGLIGAGGIHDLGSIKLMLPKRNSFFFRAHERPIGTAQSSSLGEHQFFFLGSY